MLDDLGFDSKYNIDKSPGPCKELGFDREIFDDMEKKDKIKARARHEKGGMNCLSMENKGNTISASTSQGSIHWYMDVDSKEPEERKGIWIKEE